MKRVLLPKDDVCETEGFIKGHGTETHENRIVSTYFGHVHKINKLITVLPACPFRYTPEIGDVVIGKVSQIFNKKWKLETNSKNDTTLSLTAINLPGTAQRRKSEDDEMNMHKFFGINDLIACEVQKVNKSGAAALHTRNDKYGKLENGILVCVPHVLLSPLKTRFLNRNGIEIVAGCNGFIWISVVDEDRRSYLYASQLNKAIQDLCSQQQQIDLDTLMAEIVNH